MKSKVTVNLAGGLGNQLFQYFAGLYLAQKLRRPLVVNAMLSQHGRTGHNDWIEAFTLSANAEIVSSRSQHSLDYIIFLTRRYIRGFQRRLRNDRVMENKSDFTHFYSAVIGYDPVIEGLRAPVTINGYFQSPRYFDELRRLDPSQVMLGLKSPSDWYQGKVSELANARVLALHVRRGDYHREAETFGLLDVSYYIEAMAILEVQGHEWDRIWLFSDDVEAVKVEFASRGISDLEAIQPPPGTHAAESLVLMSHVHGLVIANSTFSWWAAKLSQSDVIVAPDKWFKSMPDPETLLSGTWISAPAVWR